MSEQPDVLVSPWADASASARKVSWGSPVAADSAPAPRVDAPAPAAPIAPSVAAPELANSTTPFATLHAGAPTEDLGGLFGEPTAPEAPLDGLFGAPSATADSSGPGAADPFSDLFTSQPVEAPPPQRDALADLFGQSATNDSPAAGDDLGGLFGDEQTPAPSVEGPGEAAAQPTDPDAAAAPTVKREADSVPPTDEAAVSPSPFTTAAAGNPFATAASAEQTEAAPAAPLSRVAAQRARVDSARVATGTPTGPSQESVALSRSDRYTRAEYFTPLVERVLALGSGDGDPQMRAFLKNLELTRNHELDAQQRAAYQGMLEPKMATAGMQIHSRDDLTTLFDIAYDEMIGIGPLGPLWRDDSVTEIMVSGPYKVTIERRGQLEFTPVRFRDLEHLEETARRLGQFSRDDRAISSTNPLVTIQLPGARVQFVWRPLAVARVAITIRKFGDLLGVRELLGFGSLTEEMALFLSQAVAARATVLVSGGTGSGKTTFINALSEFIPDTERVITIEDALELQLRNTHVEAFVTKEAASADDQVLFGQDALLKASLRMRPDRIIVGEIRDAKGCAVMLEAANTGHDGTMTTIHANSPAKAISRMAWLLRRVDSMPDDVAREEVGGAIDLVVQVTRTRGRRYVSAISEVDDRGVTTDLFHGEFPKGASAPTFSRAGGLGADTALALKMLDAGLNPSDWE